MSRERRTPPGQVRIIGGEWRGRKLVLPQDVALRPSPDRVRETLFNWLAPVIDGANVLDLFAGTGALGFEALSRGAASAALVDHDERVVRRLREHAELLGANAVTVVSADALAWLRNTTPMPFDVVFLDPPFDTDLLPRAMDALLPGWLAPRARVYLEAPKIPILHVAACGWLLLREGKTRHVRYALAEAGVR